MKAARWERQVFAPAPGVRDIGDRRQLGVNFANWGTSWLWWQAGAAYDRFVSHGEGFEVSAALLRRGEDIPAMVSSLAERLERALPDHVEVARRKFGRGITIVATLNPHTYRLELRGKTGQTGGTGLYTRAEWLAWVKAGSQDRKHKAGE